MHLYVRTLPLFHSLNYKMKDILTKYITLFIEKLYGIYNKMYAIYTLKKYGFVNSKHIPILQ